VSRRRKTRNTPTLVIGSGTRRIETPAEGPLALSLIIKGLGGHVKHWRGSALEERDFMGADQRKAAAKRRQQQSEVTRELSRKWAS